MIHLSARLAWHDSGWNGRICREPALNSSCIVQEQIRDRRNDEKERAHAGVPIASLGITAKPGEQPNWKRAERWQILSPLRIHPFGTDELNRQVQMSYKGRLIQSSQKRWSKSPRPFADQQIVFTDKVIQVVNQRRRAWPREPEPLDYVANGEIGIVTRSLATESAVRAT